MESDPSHQISSRIRNLAASDRARLFLISFLILYLELVGIRWLSSYVLYLGYFTNFVLLGSLLGIGAGSLLAARKTRFVKYLPVLLFFLIPTILFSRPMVNPLFENYIYFASSTAALWLPEYVMLPLIFLCVALIFTFLGQELGILINKYEPLHSYNINILGSMAGIACFTLMSFLSLPSWVWFLAAILMLVPFLPRERSFGINLVLLLGVVLFIGASDVGFKNLWSPYYRLNLLKVEDGEVTRVNARPEDEPSSQYILQANGASHQEFTSLEESLPFYQFPYNAFKEKPVYENVLVVGAGGGNDVAAALANGVRHVDAVEIDPRIAQLGIDHHPENPYRDPRVTVVIDDARSFLRNSDKQYDLIVFALPDSLILATNASSVRLESFLFTVEAFESVRKHLGDDGLFVLYNYYRFDWLVDKISSMLTSVFGEEPYYYEYNEPRSNNVTFTTLFAGPKSGAIDLEGTSIIQTHPAELEHASDDWPFLYLKEPSLPGFYSRVLLLILIFSAAFVGILSPRRSIVERHSWAFFFMGAAFMLLETRSIVRFLLLFGSTWVVNAMVFFAILFMVLIANWLASRFRFERLWILYLLLFLSLAINYLLPLESILILNPVLRYALASAFLLSPVFFANLIYSTLFRDTAQANVAYGANILGTMVGGATEYSALFFGYQGLILFAGGFYFVAFVLLARQRRRPSIAESST